MDMLSELNLEIESKPNNQTLYLDRANLFFDVKEYEKAFCDYNKAIELDYKYVDAYQGRGNVFFYKDDYEKALSDYNKAIELDDKCASAYIGFGNIHFKRDEYQEALDNYNKAIELDKKNAEAYKMRGNLQFVLDKKNCNIAIADYTTAIELDNKFVDAYLERGKAHFYLKDNKNALVDYNKAINLDKKYVYAYIVRGDLYRTRSDYERALSNYKKAIDLDDKIANAYVSCGDLYFTKKKFELAIYNYKKAINIDDKWAAAYTGLGNVYSIKGNNALAKEYYEKAIELNAKSAYAHAGLGHLHYQHKDYDNAKIHYAKAIRIDANYAMAYNDMGTILHIKKDKEALSYLLKAIGLDENLADAHYQCGIIHYERGLCSDALDDYKKARNLYKKQDVLFNVALLDKKIKEIAGMLGEPTSSNKKIKQLMDKLDESGIKKSIEEAKESFQEFITEKERATIAVPEFLILRRWNSYTPIIADKEISKGGGYFFKIHNYGIVIDPGFNFLDNFKSAGYKFQDIDHILITHAHNDHTADLESILTLLYQYNDAILGDYDTHEEGTIMHDVFSDIVRQRKNINYEDREYIEETAKKRFADSDRRKRIRIYMTASTF